jgi:quercetin dioxygenase-like cupin family protein
MSKGSTGNIYINPVSQERAAVVISAEESGGKLLRAELWAPPGARVAAPHVHPGQSERFEVLEGRLGVRYGDTTSIARPGDFVEVPPGTVHDWWTEGEEPARVMVEVRPARRFEDMIITMWGLAAAGRTNAKGMPGPLQLALLAEEWDDTIRFVSPPRWVQHGIARALGPIARRRGLKAAYPEFKERILIGRVGEVLTLGGSQPPS